MYWLVICVNVEEHRDKHTSLGKTILLIPPSTPLAVEFNKVSSIEEHVPDEICELDI